MVPDLGSSRGESMTYKIGFSPGNVQERTRGTERTTGLMVGYEIMKVSRLLSGEDLVGNHPRRDMLRALFQGRLSLSTDGAKCAMVNFGGNEQKV